MWFSNEMKCEGNRCPRNLMLEAGLMEPPGPPPGVLVNKWWAVVGKYRPAGSTSHTIKGHHKVTNYKYTLFSILKGILM